MPLVNYCKKCKTEVPVGESCPYCYGKLTPAAEQISFGLVRKPVREWFTWNNILRIALPVWLLVCAVVVCSEAVASGEAGVIALIEQGFVRTMLWLLGLFLAGVWAVLWLQGSENVHVVLDKQGIHVRVYLPQENRLGLYLRLMTPQAAEKLAQEDGRPALQGLMLVRRTSLLWQSVSRVRIWREDANLLFFHPSFWQAVSFRCPLEELDEAEAFVRMKLKRNKKAKILPSAQR